MLDVLKAAGDILTSTHRIHMGGPIRFDCPSVPPTRVATVPIRPISVTGPWAEGAVQAMIAGAPLALDTVPKTRVARCDDYVLDCVTSRMGAVETPMIVTVKIRTARLQYSSC